MYEGSASSNQSQHKNALVHDPSCQNEDNFRKDYVDHVSVEYKTRFCAAGKMTYGAAVDTTVSPVDHNDACWFLDIGFYQYISGRAVEYCKTQHSSMTCTGIGNPMDGHKAGLTNFCAGHGAVLDPKRVSKSKTLRHRDYMTGNSGFEDAYLNYEKGFLQLPGCSQPLWRPVKKNITGHYIWDLLDSVTDGNIASDGIKVDSAVLGFRESWGLRMNSNLFHAFQDFLNVYIGSLLLGHAKPHLIWLDNNKAALYEEMLGPFFHSIKGITQFKQKVLLGQFVLAPSGNNSPLYGDLHVIRHPCWKAVFSLASLISGLVHSMPDIASVPITNAELEVVLQIRRLGAILRKITNNNEIEEVLRSVPSVQSVTALDFAKVPTFREQLAVMARCDVFVAPHGAGGVWAAFLPRYGGFIELTPVKVERNKLHAGGWASSVHVARWAGAPFVRVVGGADKDTTGDVERFEVPVDKLRKTMEEVVSLVVVQKTLAIQACQKHKPHKI
eukprot:gnl/MRDRNA2_/MRDRNA2_147966_c0_seq1.p1 gnl/MRDRNA2_/MRDRNA2_147966_c0~~gnl/MRDRNA2_/MRDRNA2_147966_c0_seq1.p1  ORF type:complete len:499 (+),score=76.63 gnl/MRDRNA2_/MRDRNA2_147966_c0_seq1:91-1587(+)